MKIISKIYKELLCSADNLVFETGGILGSADGETITDFVLDKLHKKAKSCCVYYPNVEFLNEQINNWSENGIRFMGVFHNHFAGVKTLSEGDKKYIKKIMSVMPTEIKKLYFPIIVLPEKELVCYTAIKEQEIVLIEENISVI